MSVALYIRYINKMKLLLHIFLLLIIVSFIGCGSCRRNKEPTTTVTSRPLTLDTREAEKEVDAIEKKGPKIRYIEIGPSKKGEQEAEEEGPDKEKINEIAEINKKIAEAASLPPETYEETDLTNRLRSKLLEAYGGKEENLPDVKIYTSEMKYDDFVTHYKNLGYKVQTVAVPASQVIEPVLSQRPELAGKINIADYEDVVIHQVMIDELGISAADKYIDPDTFQVIDRTFVTKMGK